MLDLTHTSPTMPPKGTKRSAPGAGGSTNGTRATRAGGSPSNNTISPPPAKRTKTSTSTTKPSASMDDLFGSPGKEDEVDLVGVNDDEDYEKAAKKRKEEEAAKKRKEEQEKPVKLAQQQCVICLDQPDGLTVTHCGKSSRWAKPLPPSAPGTEMLGVPKMELELTTKQDICSAPNASTAHSTQI